jgi:N-acetylmuramoyl-L-alanine amidase
MSINRIIAYVLIAASAALMFFSISGYNHGYAKSSDAGLKGKLIVIDPGHGGVDGGASLGEHFNEKDINLDISLKLRDLLMNAGIKVILTRDSDISLENKSDLQSTRHRRDLDARRDIVNNSGADAFISVHSNCFRSNPETKGAILFYYNASEEGKNLAQWVGSSIDEIVYRRFLKNDTQKSKILPESLFLLRSTKVPGILVETGYMTNLEEGRLLRQDDFQAFMAEAIFDGLQNYYRSK